MRRSPRCPRFGSALISLSLLLPAAGCLNPDERLERRMESIQPQLVSMEPLVAHSIYGMVATGSGEATQAGVEILEAGGNAVDAAVAVAFALGVADPADSGLGGTTSLIAHFADGRTIVVDGSSTVPMKTDKAAITAASKEGSTEARGHALAATPGTPRALEYTLRNYGTFALSAVLAPAIRIAEEGYLPAPFHRVTGLRYAQAIDASEYFRYLVLKDGVDFPEPHEPFCRPDLARTLKRIARRGIDDFYEGEIAEEIASDMAKRGGFVTRADLSLLRAHEVKPLRTTYRGYEVLTTPSPTIGGALIQSLNMLESFPQETLRDHSVDRLQILSDIANIALEDHHRFNPRPDLPLPYRVKKNLSKEYAAERARIIHLGRAVSDEQIRPVQRFRTVEEDTTQVSIIDRWGNAVSLTQTLGRFYGCKAATAGLGFPYNSHLEGLRAYRSRGLIPISLAPAIVLSQGEPVLVLGSAGSDRVPSAMATVISLFIDSGKDLAGAVAGPRVTWWRGLWEGEPWVGPLIETIDGITTDYVEELHSRGYSHTWSIQPPAEMMWFLDSGAVNAVALDRSTRTLTGVGDPRRIGVANGARF